MLIIPFIVLTILQYVAAADKRHLQSSMNMDIPAVAWDVSTYVEGTTPTFFTAAEVMDNTDDNNILSEFIRGFGALSNKAFEEIFGKKKKKLHLPTRGLRTNNDIRELQQLMPLVVTDIPCPDTITYPPPSGVTCLQFGIEIETGNMAPEDVLTFEDFMATAISEGQLYDTIKSESPDTYIQGVGDPGNGFMIPDEPAFTLPATTEAPDIATMPVSTEAAAEEPGTIVDIAIGNPDFSTLVAAVSAAGLVEALSGDGPLTVFAPTNEAFAALPEGTLETLLLPENIDALTDILTYHVVAAEAPSTSLVTGDVVTLNGDPVLVTVSDDGVMVNNANVIIPDIMASNGIIHVIDKVLIPPEGPTTLPEGEEELGPELPVTTEAPPDTTEAPPDTTEAAAEEPGTIVDIAIGNPDFSTLVAAVSAAGLVEALSGDGPLTVFAPTNEAFAALPEGTVETLLLPENIDALTDILTYHVVAAEAPSSSLVTGDVVTLNGEAVLVTVSDGGVMVNDANVIIPDIMASNGIIHVIDKVLIPPEDEEEVPATTEAPPDTTEAPLDTTEAPIITTEAAVPDTLPATTEAPEIEIPDVPAPAPEVPEGGATKATKVPLSMHAKSSKSSDAKSYKQAYDGVYSKISTKSSKEGKSGKAFATKSGKATHDIVVKDPKAEKISVAKAEEMVSKASKTKATEGAKSGKALDKASKAVKEMSVRL